MTFSGLIQSIESIWMRNLTFFGGNMFRIFFDRKFVFQNFISQKQESLNIMCATNGEVGHLPKKF